MDAVREHGTWISDHLYPDTVNLCDYDGVFAEEEDAVEIKRIPGGYVGDFCVCIYLDIYSKVFAERVHELKETEKGVDFMCREMEEMYSEGMEIGEKRGEKCGMKFV